MDSPEEERASLNKTRGVKSSRAVPSFVVSTCQDTDPCISQGLFFLFCFLDKYGY